MATATVRITSTGNLFVRGQLDEYTRTVNSIGPDTIYCSEYDETSLPFSGNGVVKRETVNGKLFTTGALDEVNEMIVTANLIVNLNSEKYYNDPDANVIPVWNDLSTDHYANIAQATAPTYSSDVGGNFVFNGTSMYANLEPIADLPVGNNPGTIAGWARPAAANSYRWIVSYGNPATSQARYIGVGPNANFFTGSYAQDINVSGVSLDTWYYVASTFDGTTLKLYVNAQEQSSTASVTFNTVANTAQIGRQVNWNEYWSGNIGAIHIYDRALSAAEILENFNATRTRYGV
jgi:hypothetical protein